MKNIEYFRSPEELYERINQLRAQGIANHNLEIISNKELDGDLVNADINQRKPEPTFGDKIAAFFTGEDPEDRVLDSYEFTEVQRQETLSSLRAGNLALIINNNEPNGYFEGMYGNEMDEDLRLRDDISEEEKIRLHEERLRINKDRVQTGEVEINKEIVTEHQEIEVPVEKEVVTIERRKVGERETHDFDKNLGEDSIRVPIHEERINVEKENVVTEEIVINKDIVQETEKVSADIQKEKVDIDETENGFKDGNRF